MRNDCPWPVVRGQLSVVSGGFVELGTVSEITGMSATLKTAGSRFAGQRASFRNPCALD